ncbi:ABC transporter ATP-binding protein [Staphylococcus saprophyticus]|uniref:ABC-type multidrug protein lipid transport system ATPase component n=1 Tax=Staphylococcus saprophyticus subsp. saprophyticus (strain ATCC 15305 / DSM 20229 / NCIMB 8711 / NCTC 7292 / S-41) TaxID=342451 RepID=Q4A083_STAS1|nr:ABC transporter ATP-binding protein [Staphylococcus saprophyticus]ASF19500.1 ABC transporter ATP-binding protein [Staphylococcus saprophyticus]MDW3917411.1 ABC transporter ATP-binding protein [Staphylococcus saprophyticus]OOC98814.1 multidrug ABC transporter ATP-binding protein [Staphylococcus saprophyticus subsp. saprophyticus ATCC 15305 = NCTC 7292]QCY41688.1 ABC transporter ATP-binding protein [Staphylococcus saprophyticus subsp. saprophyticus ATCC 15305 = NCTC 7292]RTX70014.1 ABC transp
MTENANLTAKDQGSALIRLFKYTLPYKWIIVLAFITLILSTIASMMTPYMVKIFIDDYLTPRHFPKETMVWLIVIFISIQLIGAITLYFSQYLFQYLAFKVIQQLRIDAFNKLGKLGMRYFDKVPGGSIVSRLTNDTETIVDMIVGVFSTFIMAFFMMISSYIMMFVLDVKLALIALIFLPIIMIILASYRKYSAFLFSKSRQRLSDLNSKLAESIEGMKIIQAFNQERRLNKEFNKINDEHYQYMLKTVKLDSLLLRPAISSISIFAVVMILGYFGVISFTTGITAGVVFAFVQYMERFFEPINQVSQNLNILQQALVSASRVFALINDDTYEPQQEANNDNAIETGEIEFDNVSFSYDGETDVLKNISLTAKPGEMIALVGHTGSGKSSIINLFMRFYEFNRGDIKIDGNSIKKIPKTELKEKIGLVLQDAFMFYGTIASNIKLYHPSMTFEQVKAAAEFVHANHFIEKLPNQYQHKVIEKGSAFSSGERQLIAFARTIATNPKILILDEATANIDSETEEQIQQSLNKMRKGRTTLAIAHRLSTIQDADQIFVLNKGEIVERGTHAQLIAQKGIYHNMYLLQNG